MSPTEVYLILSVATGVVWARYMALRMLEEPEGVEFMRAYKSEDMRASARVAGLICLGLLFVLGALFWMPIVAWWLGGLMRRSA